MGKARKSQPKQRVQQATKSFLDYIADKSIGIKDPFVMKYLYGDYKLECNYPYATSKISSKFRPSLAPTIWKLEQFDEETRARMLFATSTSVHKDFLKKLRKRASVTLDDQQRITKYKSPTMQLSGNHYSRRGRPLVGKNSGNDADEDAKSPTQPKPKESVRKSARNCRNSARNGLNSSQNGQNSVQNGRKSVQNGLNSVQNGRNSVQNGLHSAQNGLNPAQNGINPDEHLEVIGDPQLVRPIQIKRDTDYSNQELVPSNYFVANNYNYSSPQYYGSPYYSNPAYYSTPPYYSNPFQGMGGLLNSLTGFLQTQTQFMREVTRTTTQLTAPVSTAPPTVTPAGSAHSSVSDFLKFVQSSIIKWDNFQLSDILQKIVINLQKVSENGDRMCSKSGMKMALESAFSIGSTGSISNGAHLLSSFVDTKEFFNMIMMYSSTQQFYGLCEQVKQRIDGLNGPHVIPVHIVRVALESAIRIVME